MKMKLSACKTALLYALALSVPLIAAQLFSRSVTTMTEYMPIPDRHCIVIDAGHGGIDGGAVSCTGVPESGINLQIAQRLDDLMHLVGYKTLMLRQTDTSLHTEGTTIAQQKVSDLKYRVNVINNTENALLVSIHQNTFSDSRYRGSQVFYASDDDSQELAQSLQEAMSASLHPGSHRKAKQAKGIYLMEHIQCTGVLIECGFLTNPEEEALLRSETYQQKLSSVIAASLSSYLNQRKLEHTTIG